MNNYRIRAMAPHDILPPDFFNKTDSTETETEDPTFRAQP
jgi:hypothetical protein